MEVKDIVAKLEELAPPALQESYDNSGLLVGEPKTEVTGVLVSLDVTESIVQEAINEGCNMIVSHHPIIFGGLKRLTGKNYVERTVMMALRNNIALYAIHTNLDNVMHGVNNRIAEKLQLGSREILKPIVGRLLKLVTFAPKSAHELVLSALFSAGAGHIGNYSECSFSLEGAGTFKGGEGTNPAVGKQGERHTEEEFRIEVILPDHLKHAVLNALIKAHPYEEVAYDFYRLENSNQNTGAGMIGSLKEPQEPMEFLKHLKETFGAGAVRYTEPVKDVVQNVAVCGGSGSFLLPDAIRKGADVFITGDFKYHQFFDAENRIMIADIGHYESEQFTIGLLAEHLTVNFPNFAVRLTNQNTNPVKYL